MTAVVRKITSTQSRKGIIEEVRDHNGDLKTSNLHSQRAAQLYRFTELEPQLSLIGNPEKRRLMKAILFTKYGTPDVIQLGEVEKPTPKDNEVLIRIYATTVTAGDCELRSFKIPILLWLPMRIYMGLRKPRRPILGMELAGEIESVGKRRKTI